MILLEYEAKTILSRYSIPVPKGHLISSSSDTIFVPSILKSQVPTGGRGKNGGIKRVDSIDQATEITAHLFRHPIKGFLPTSLLAEEVIAIDKEFYLAIIIDRSLGSLILMAHPDGGVDVEEHNAHEFLSLPLPETSFEQAGQTVADFLSLPEQTFVLQDIIKNIYACMVKEDATLIEINPLILTQDNHLIAGDCKMMLDDAAAFRHPNWQFTQDLVESNFVTLNPHGTVATIANGAGLAMATVDAVTAAGLTPANFLDIGGGASSSSVLAAFKQLVAYPEVGAIVINIFAGITKCDEVARAIIDARSHITNLPPLYIRLAGNNYDAAVEILSKAGVPLLPTLEDCIAAVKEGV